MIEIVFKSKSKPLLILLLAALIIHAVMVFQTGWDHPILEHHSIRQSITAITAYWLKQGGPLFSPETPFWGYPWSVPLEFPLYEFIVAKTSLLLNQDLDQSGRLINILFYLLTFIPLFLILRNLGTSLEVRIITLCLFLSSPLYLYWSRTFMFESTALFFSTLYLSLVLSYIKSKKILYITFACIAGTIGILAKVTTFVLFFIPAGYFMWLDWKKNEGFSLNWKVVRKKALLFFLLVIIPIVSVLIWIDHSDTLKNEREFKIWTSTQKARWNWGTFSQRFSPNTWRTITGRALYEILGPTKLLALPLWTVMVFLFLLFFKKIKNKMIIGIFILAYFSAFFLFPNLHVIHDYYQYANTLFFIIAVGLFIHALLNIKDQKFPRFLGIFLIILFITSGIYGYYHTYYKFQKNVYPGQKNILKVARIVEQVTEPDEVIAVYSTWTHREISYYSKRRSINLKWFKYDRQSFQRALGGLECGALLIEVIYDKSKPELMKKLGVEHLTQKQRIPYYTIFYKNRKINTNPTGVAH
jgi:hypothetical protein